jgi:hypothetical protein
VLLSHGKVRVILFIICHTEVGILCTNIWKQQYDKRASIKLVLLSRTVGSEVIVEIIVTLSCAPL